ncbi:VUT family protein [Cardiobacteriaceae bacterium TAE3-ERU3]|nr:VUT family protein [Cardiobacteriaceae bacterium TAE3-ERU3]
MNKTLSPSGWQLPCLIALYVGAILLANLTLDDFIPLPGYGLLSIGTIFFAAIFTLRDRIHRVGGVCSVFIAITLAVIINTVTAGVLDTPIRFICASFIAILFGELADTAVYHRLLHRSWALRVVASNAVSVPLDSVLFTLLAFYGDLSGAEIAQIIFADIAVKYSISLLFMLRLRSSRVVNI